jgi:hypothetical protein
VKLARSRHQQLSWVWPNLLMEYVKNEERKVFKDNSIAAA